MKSLTGRLRLGALVAVAFTLSLSIGSPVMAAGDQELGTAAWSMPVPAGITQLEVKDAIVAAFAGREWGIRSQSDERIVGYLKHRSNEAKVTFVYSASKIDVFCLGWQINKKTGVREKPELPRGWLNNLKGDITKIFNRSLTAK